MCIYANTRFARVCVCSMSFQSLLSQFPDVFVHKDVGFHDFGDSCGWGCVAKSNIPSGTLLMQIPHSACICGTSELDLAQNILAQFRLKTGRLYEYISRVFDSGSLDDLLKIWQNVDRYRCTSLSAVLACMQTKCLNNCTSMCMCVHALAYMYSRSFESEFHTIASVPFGDIFNHSSKEWSTRIREDVCGFSFFSERDVSAGEQIFNNYGNDVLDCTLMMATHGFDSGDMCEVLYMPAWWMNSGENAQDDYRVIRVDRLACRVCVPPGCDSSPIALQIALAKFEWPSPCLNGCNGACVSRCMIVCEEEYSDCECTDLGHHKTRLANFFRRESDCVESCLWRHSKGYFTITVSAGV